MERDFKKVLINWKNHPLRKPLIVRGARQVGKTFIIEAFGRERFQNLVTINFESSPLYRECFETFNVRTIIKQIELLSGQKIVPGKTLLFLDEIQQAPKALQSLRYFKEEMEELHLIAAGSLLEFAIQEENFSFPVGRVQFAKLYPLSFKEFLSACGDHQLREALFSFTLFNPPPKAIHEHLLERVKSYFVVGGMPAAVKGYLKTHSYLEVKYEQKALWEAFSGDFGKYAKQSQYRYLKKIFEQGPGMIGSRIKYSRIDPDLPNPSREMKLAIELLKLAGLLHPIVATSAGAIPLVMGEKQNIFKWLFLDIGLVEQVLNVDPLDAGLLTGGLAEQFVGQEILAYSDSLLEARLFFWLRDSKDSSAEVDYVFALNNHIFPIEVKAGKSGKLKSLKVFVEEKKASFGIKISQDYLEWNKGVLSVPFYMISHLPRLIEEALKIDQP